MEEVSSLDSFHTDDGEETSARNNYVPPKSDEEDEEDGGGGGGDDEDDVDGEGEGEGDADADGDGDNVDNSGGGDEEFEQISEGTFDVDENSQATSVERTPADNDKEPEEAIQNTTDFEEIDANVSVNTNTNVAQAAETDMLGGNDGDITENKDDTDANKSNDSVGDMEVEQHSEEPAVGCDVEMHSSPNSPQSQNEKQQQQGDESMDTSGEVDDDFVREQSLEEKSAMEARDTSADAGKDVVDAEESGEKETNEDGNDTATGDGDQNVQHEKDRDEDVAEDDENCTGENEADGDNAEDDENEPVENVQEPEESDVCLIPDDTETEVTEAEKEQAILARKNAEEEDTVVDSGETPIDDDIDRDIKTHKEPKSSHPVETETFDNDDDETVEDDDGRDAHQAVQAGAQVSDSSKGNMTAATASNADEPLLEELHKDGTTEGGAIGSTKTIIAWTVSTLRNCVQCGEEKACGYRYRNTDTKDLDYLCDSNCCEALLNAQPGKFFVRRKKFLVEELQSGTSEESIEQIAETTDPDGNSADSTEQRTTPLPIDTAAAAAEHTCVQCKETKKCKYFFKQDDENFYFCNDDCYNLMNAEEPDKFKLKRHSIRVRTLGGTLSPQSPPSIKKNTSNTTEMQVVARTTAEADTARLEREASFLRSCAECFQQVTLGGKHLQWETMDFCNEICLGKYQRSIGGTCQTCQGEVSHQALGKYCVRFGFDIRQFCCAICLNEFKKGLKMCSCCQKDISGGNEGFLAPVGDKEQFKDFCSQSCMRRYDSMNNARKKSRIAMCAVCNTDKPVRIEVMLDDKDQTFCSNPCFSAFKFVSNVVPDQCGMCSKYFERKSTDAFTIYTERRPKAFCSRICLNVYIISNRRIVSCQWCKVKKYNFDMIYKQQDAQEILMCSINCLTLYGVSINAFSRTVAKCDNCNASATPQYHLTMSDASMRNFCTYQCVMQFQSQFARAPLTLDHDAQHGPSATAGGDVSSVANSGQSISSGNAGNGAPFPTGLPKRVRLKHQQSTIGNKNSSALKGATNSLPIISNVASLASGGSEMRLGGITVRRGRCRGRKIDSPGRGGMTGVSSSMPGAQPVARGRPRKNIDYAPPRSPSPNSYSSTMRSSSGGRRGPGTPSDGLMGTSSSNATKVSETKIITVPPYPPKVRNVQTHCRPQTCTVGFQTMPNTADVGCQTDKDYSNKVLIPVPVPIFLPQPMYMYSAPFPVPVPIPLPIPVPIFIPTTRNSAQGILKEIKKIQDKMPADPFEAELLMMAEMVAEEKRESDSDSDEEVKPDPNVMANIQYGNNMQSVDVATNNAYGEDVLQMALKMATSDYEQPTVDLESAMTANTITHPPTGMATHDTSMAHLAAQQQHHLQAQQQQQQQHQHQPTPPHQSPAHHMMEPVTRGRGRKRGAIATPVSPRNNRSPGKRQRLQELEPVAVSAISPTATPTQPIMHNTEKPDANMCLKYTFGVNAWKQWVMTKNADEKNTIRRRTFKTELLQMTADELNYSLCLFVKEVRKPNGTEYAPDTIYYLVLGIQQYLYENGRIDNIFTDPYYERFTDCLDEVARKFSVLYNDSQYIVTRVEEEHLWECKQLGAHSPHVLLSTLMFFNTKHFNLTTVEEHMQLSFSHIMKHWKRSAQSAKTPGTRNVLLRFYPPQAGLDANPRKKKVYEQQENEDNPLRCPVRLYEFYLSKCPESVKTRNDVFYLQPERSCVPDSPVWYSTQALSQEALQKMLHRVKMVKEINIALLTS